MNYEKTTIKILQWIVVIAGIIVIGIRCCVKESYINICMAVVNVISFGVSLNILLMDLYIRFKQKYNKYKMKRAFLKMKKIRNVAMFSYLCIFLLNFLLVMVVLYYYFLRKMNIALYNDVFGIISLILAISYDVINRFFVAIIMFFI